MLVDAVKQRLTESGFERVDGAVQMQDLITKGGLPAADATLFVLPSAMRGGAVRASSGLFVQDTEQTVSVYLALRHTGGNADTAIDPLQRATNKICAALAGWTPPGGADVFRLSRASIVSFAQGVILYQADFIIQDQLRIPT